MFSTLTASDVLAIHEELAADFAAAADPISPSGVKSLALLESAVARQYAGFHDRLKYDTPVVNAAALTYGICLNHPFHNGNKRTSLVSLLCHLDKNNLTFDDTVRHEDLYDFMIKVASHAFASGKGRSDFSDQEVGEMAKWIRKRTRRTEKGDRLITFRELKTILNAYGFFLENLHGNAVDVVRYEKKFSILALKRQDVRERIMRMGYPSDGVVVGRGQLKDLRERCGLTEKNGIDSHTFYSKSRPVDYFVGKYRGTLRRLARV